MVVAVENGTILNQTFLWHVKHSAKHDKYDLTSTLASTEQLHSNNNFFEYVKPVSLELSQSKCNSNKMAFQTSKVKMDLKNLTPAPDRPRIFMSSKTSKVVVVFPNGEVVEGEW